MDSRVARNGRLPEMLLAGVSLVAGAAPSSGQAGASPAPAAAAPAALPTFEVATIKPSSDTGRSMLMFTPDGVSISGVPMQMILREAFRTEDDHVFGAPPWVKSTRYDIQAKVSAEDAPKLKDLKGEQRMEMLLPLLVDRFNLKYHHETRELTTYSLVVAKGGVKMAVYPAVERPIEDTIGHGFPMSRGTSTASQLADMMTFFVNRPVIDKTGLTERYNYVLSFAPMSPQAGADAPEFAPPDFFTAVQKQLGLKLESGKDNLEVVVVDHMERMPTEN